MRAPVWLEAAVVPEFIDANGHMNIRHYLDLGAHATMVLCEGLGIDDAYRAERRLGVFTTEHHLRYYSDMRIGEKISVHVRLLDRSAKAAHMMAFLANRSQGRLANTLELALVHVDLETRRAIAFPDDAAAGLDRHLAVEADLEWPAPVCGVMGIRR
jgi:acyl-CoA thioester hydrolase